VFAVSPADFFFSHPINLVLLNGFDVFMEKKHNNDAHGEISELTQFPLVLFTSLISCLMAIACSLFSRSLSLF